MLPSLPSVLVAGTIITSFAFAQIDPKLTGTWSTKSRQVFTGPGFYDPVNERMFEPNLTGISYSFTDDGYYEEAYYRAISNPTTPTCPQGIMQYQHGTFKKAANGSLFLTPFGVDGRQLLSSPCAYQNSIYTRYNQSEYFQRYSVYTDPYHNVPRLDLYQFDGSPMNPMYLAYHPPQMLPTSTLNPTSSPATATASSSTKSSKSKRSLGGLKFTQPVHHEELMTMKRQGAFNADRWWWVGVGLTAVGSVGYFCF
ncbi:Reversal of tor2 lethality [Varicellaria rhodocarpa]|nr:Reversal of tor2 lethality [Varicellaria rhodocarpa]